MQKWIDSTIQMYSESILTLILKMLLHFMSHTHNLQIAEYKTQQMLS